MPQIKKNLAKNVKSVMAEKLLLMPIVSTCEDLKKEILKRLVLEIEMLTACVYTNTFFI